MWGPKKTTSNGAAAWRAPNRPSKAISQTFNDGVVTVYAVTDTAVSGYQPREKLTEKERLNFDERSLGLRRYYSGRQNQVEISHVIRTPRRDGITTKDIAEISDVKYRIVLIQYAQDVYPPSMDMSLERIEPAENDEDEESEEAEDD